MSKAKHYLLPFGMTTMKPKSVMERIIVTLWFLLHVGTVIFFIAGTVYFTTQAASHYHNSHLSPQEYGQLIKQTFPVYNNVSDEQLGTKFLAKKQALIKSGKTNLTSEDINIMDIDASLNTDWVSDIKSFGLFVLVPSVVLIIFINFMSLSLYKIWGRTSY